MNETVNVEYALKAELTRWLCLLSFAVELLLLFLLTHIFLPEGKESNSIVFLVLALPLFAFTPFLIKRNIKAHAWLMFTSLFYFSLVVLNIFDPNYHALLARIEFGNIIILFCTSMLFTRYEQRRLGITITPKTIDPL